MYRKGLTLLEVMFAIGVAGIGILGIMAVLPLALHQVGSGNVADRASRLGLNALAEFQVRGMADPANWRVFDSATSAFVQVPSPPYGQASFVIDPRFLAAPANRTVIGSRFPYIATAPYRMDRLTLRASPVLASGPMDLPQADRLFRMSDDLVLDVPPDKTLPPVLPGPGLDGQWGIQDNDDDKNGVKDDISEAGSPGSDDETRRTEGAFSWMAMLTPRLDQRDPATFTDAQTDLYTLYVIVFHKRDPQLEMNETNERIALIAPTNFHSLGKNGGDVTISSSSTSGAADLEMKAGDWLLLSGKLQPASTSIVIFRWYRIDDTEHEPSLNSTGVWERDATLYGADWPVPRVIGPTQAILVANVVGVYQAIIRLERSSLWTG